VSYHNEWDPGLGDSRRANAVRIHTKSGRTLVHTSEGWDDPALFTYEDTARKFHDCAQFSGVCPPAKADSIVERVKEFESVYDIGAFLTSNLVLL